MKKEPLILLEHAAPPGGDVELAPGERLALSDLVAGAVEDARLLKAPSYALCRMMRLGNGDYRPVPVEWSNWVAVNADLAARLGMKISRQTLQRLWRNGYIVMRQTSPHVVELNLESFVEHLRRVHDNPGFWGEAAPECPNLSRRAAYVSEIY